MSIGGIYEMHIHLHWGSDLSGHGRGLRATVSYWFVVFFGNESMLVVLDVLVEEVWIHSSGASGMYIIKDIDVSYCLFPRG